MENKLLSTLLSATLVAGVVVAGCGGIASGGAIKVVSELPMTGAALSETQPIVNAITMALEERDYRVCNGRWAVQYEAHDDTSAARAGWDPDVVANNAKYFVSDTSIVAVIGSYDSEASKILIPALNEEQLVIISPASTLSSLTKPGTGDPGEPDIYYPSGVRNFTRLIPAGDAQAAAAAKWAKQLAAKSVYVLDDQSTSGRELADSFVRAAEKLGLLVLGHESIDAQASDYTAVSTQLTSLNPSLIYFGGAASGGGGLLVKDLRAVGYGGMIMASDGMYDPALIDIAGGAANGTYITTATVAFPQFTARAEQWRRNYKAKFGFDPGRFALYGYAAGTLLLDAFERVCAAGRLPSDRRAVRDAVFATTGFDSAIGRISIDANGDAGPAVMSGAQVREGGFIFIEQLSGG